MKFGFVLPGGTATEQVEQAVLAEAAGWDGIFAWEAAYGVDPWTMLSAMAQRTSRIRLGTMLTPLPWRRPWKLASQVATLDQLSAGRAILAVGLGAVDPELGTTPEVTDRRQRAEMLDEGIDLIKGFWNSQLEFQGKHYRIDLRVREDFARAVKPVQRPGIPIWVVGAWPREKSMLRVLRCDGVIPYIMGDDGPREGVPEDISAMLQWLRERGGAGDGFDVLMEGETPADDPAAAAEIVRPWAEAGCTWWMETRWASPNDSPEQMQRVRERLAAGPPRV